MFGTALSLITGLANETQSNATRTGTYDQVEHVRDATSARAESETTEEERSIFSDSARKSFPLKKSLDGHKPGSRPSPFASTRL